jgi:hypothetical protein
MHGNDATQAGRIFISYRREETAYAAGWLYDVLDSRLGDGQVFKDIDSISPGDDFVEVITRAVGSCDVLLALIGERWLTITDERGQRRIDDPDDFVRLEIEAALTRNVRVIPVLVDRTSMPRADELPESMARLVRRQAVELSPSRFESDAKRLLSVLEATLADVRTAPGAAAAEGEAPARTVVPSRSTDEAAAAGAQRTEDPPPPAPPSTDPVTSAGGSSSPVQPPERSRERPPWAWILAAAALVVALVLVIAVLLRDGSSGDDGASAEGIELDATPATSGDGLEVSNLAAGPGDPARGDTITVSYSLRNVGDEPLELEYIFVGARDEADEFHDEPTAPVSETLAPDESVDVRGRVVLDSSGIWYLWPCYALASGSACPDEWMKFSVVVA